MFGLDWGEVFIIFVVFIVVTTPKDLPKFLHFIAKAAIWIRNYRQLLARQFDTIVQEMNETQASSFKQENTLSPKDKTLPKDKKKVSNAKK